MGSACSFRVCLLGWCFGRMNYRGDGYFKHFKFAIVYPERYSGKRVKSITVSSGSPFSFHPSQMEIKSRLAKICS